MIRRPPRSTQSRSSAASDVYKRGVFKPDDLLRTSIASARAPAVHGALSYRAQSSGTGKPNTAANVRRCPTPSPCSTPTAPRRNAQLLPSGRSLTNVDSFFGQCGRDLPMVADRHDSEAVALQRHTDPSQVLSALETVVDGADRVAPIGE